MFRVLILFLLLILGLIAFAIYPRDTNFAIASIDIDTDNPTSREGDRVLTNWKAHVRIANNNYFPIDIKGVKIIVYLDDDRRAPIGLGGGAELHLPARSQTSGQVNFTMPVYAPSSGMPSLIGECMTQSTVKLFIITKVDLSWMHWTGYQLPIEHRATLDCQLTTRLLKARN